MAVWVRQDGKSRTPDAGRSGMAGQALPAAGPRDAGPVDAALAGRADHGVGFALAGGDDSVAALSDRIEPQDSCDHTIPRFTWWDHRGTKEWVQYDVRLAAEGLGRRSLLVRRHGPRPMPRAPVVASALQGRRQVEARRRRRRVRHRAGQLQPRHLHAGRNHRPAHRSPTAARWPRAGFWSGRWSRVQAAVKIQRSTAQSGEGAPAKLLSYGNTEPKIWYAGRCTGLLGELPRVICDPRTCADTFCRRALPYVLNVGDKPRALSRQRNTDSEPSAIFLRPIFAESLRTLRSRPLTRSMRCCAIAIARCMCIAWLGKTAHRRYCGCISSPAACHPMLRKSSLQTGTMDAVPGHSQLCR